MTVRELINKLESVCGEGSLMDIDIVCYLGSEPNIKDEPLYVKEVNHAGDAIEIELY